jgi:hypothetical protein
MTNLIDQYKKLHEEKENYGTGYNTGTSKMKGFDLKYFLKFLTENKSEFILDYGCGKGKLVEFLNEKEYRCAGYDPAVEKYNKINLPEWSFDTLICLDVLEHIPEDEIDGLLDDILSYDTNTLFFIVSCKLAKTKLPDGTNPHVTVKPVSWWGDKFNKFFKSHKISSVYDELRKEVTFKLWRKNDTVEK